MKSNKKHLRLAIKNYKKRLSRKDRIKFKKSLKVLGDSRLASIWVMARFASDEGWNEYIQTIEKKDPENSAPAQDTATLKKKRLRRLKITAAAGMVLVCVMALFFLINKSLKQNGLPIANGVILELGDGRPVMLDTVSISGLPDQGNCKLFVGGGMLRYVPRQNGPYYKRPPVLNRIKVPGGKQYTVKLPDGSTVCLNEYSTIRFPVCDTLLHRSIAMRGEAYFKIAPLVSANKKMPFTVHVETNTGLEQRITVLGTIFNVNAYPDTPFLIKTTLVEGVVKIESGKKAVIMKPGEMVQVSKNKIIKTKENVKKDAIAWKNDVFIFTDATIKNILKELECWYAQPIEYIGDTQSKISIMLPRSIDHESIIKGVAKVGNCTFQKKGNVIRLEQQH